MELKPDADETATPNVPTEEENESEETPEQPLEGDQLNNTEEEETDDEVIDYKAELEKQKALADSYKTGMLKKERENRELRGQAGEADVDSIVETVTQKVREEMGQFQSSMVENVIDDEANAISANDDEKALILHHFENTIQRSGSTKGAIKRDLELAKVIANKDKILKQYKSLQHAEKVNSTTPQAPNFNSQKLQPKPKSNLPKDVEKFGNAMDKFIQVKYKKPVNK